MYNGARVHNTKTISNIIGKHLEDVSGMANIDEHFKKIKTKKERPSLNFETTEDIYYNSKFSLEELENALDSCSTSAPGKDNVNFDMIKNLAPLAKSYLLQFYNHLWTKHSFPKAWSHAIIIPVAKAGKDPSYANNYRPISLTSCLCKVMEKMVNNRLTWVMKKHKVITPTQFGSQPNRSTVDSLAHLENHIRRGFERKHITVAIFFDIQKAYDTTWRYSILNSLHSFGFRGNLPIFVRNFLTDRTFQTRIDDTHSNEYKLERGVPQGSVLSGTLFSIAINEITSQLPQGVQNNLYVDDFAIYYSSSNLRHTQRILNSAVEKIYDWSKNVGFKLSVDKTKAVMFYKNIRWKKDQELELKMKDFKIPVKESVKFLGLIFDTHLNWKAHISYTKAKCKSSLNLLKKLSHTNWGADRSTLLTLYKSTVLSIIDYGSQIYGSASEAVLNNLNPIQTQGLRICTGAFRSSPNSSVLSESGEMPLRLHRELVTMRSALKIQASDSPTKKLFGMSDIFINNHSPPFPIRANRLMEETRLEVIFPPIVEYPPPWTIRKPRICCHLYYLSKRSIYTPSHHKQHSLEHIRRKGPHFAIYTDGSKSPSGVGFAAVSSNRTIQFSLPTYASVFTAELMAILAAIEIIKDNPPQKFVIFSDSRSAVEVLKSYSCKNPLVLNIRNLLHKMHLSDKEIEICWIPAHVDIKGNEEADKAAKSAVNMPIYPIKIPINDYIAALKPAVTKKWQNLWDNEPDTNKLKEIKKTVSPWTSSKQLERYCEVIITRIRIGHTRLTHGYLMENPHSPIPRCPSCHVTLSVKHIITECPLYDRQRIANFGRKTFTEILAESNTFSIIPIINFLRNCNLIKSI